MVSIYKAVSDLEAQLKSGALCTIVHTTGSTPRHETSKMLVYPDGTLIGTVGGGEVEGRVISEALDSIKDNKSRKLQYKMVNPKEGDPGICGGQLEIYIEPIVPQLLLVIGGGHVGKCVSHLAKWLGFQVAVSDDRPEFCSTEANPDADLLLPVRMAEIPNFIDITPFTYIVLTTRGAPIDIEGIPPLLDSKAGYIGVIGSRRRWITTRKGLQEAGVSEEAINRIHSPIGLELQAETPEEIAVSIMAEIIMLRNGGSGRSMKS